MRILILSLCLTALCGGCSALSGSKSPHASTSQEVMLYLDQNRPKAALAAADELVAQAPEDYQSYLTRSAVHLVLRDYAQAQADNARALEVFTASAGRYPEKERGYRQAKIRESMALTALVASRRAQDPAERERLRKQFEAEAAQVKELDEDTWKNLRGLIGQQVD